MVSAYDRKAVGLLEPIGWDCPTDNVVSLPYELTTKNRVVKVQCDLIGGQWWRAWHADLPFNKNGLWYKEFVALSKRGEKNLSDLTMSASNWPFIKPE